MTRTDTLRNLTANSASTDQLRELAAELDLPLADLYVIAGHPVPARMRPPERDPRAL